MRRSRSLFAAGALTLTLVIGGILTGCSDSDGDAPGPVATSSGAATSSDGASPDGAETPSTPASSSVAPAAGVVVAQPELRLHAPDGWKKSKQLVRTMSSATSKDSKQGVSITSLPAFGTKTLHEQAQRSLGGYSASASTMKEKKPVEIAGQEMFHLAGTPDGYRYLDFFGTIRADHIISIQIDVLKDYPVDRRQQLVAEILASVEWLD